MYLDAYLMYSDNLFVRQINRIIPVDEIKAVSSAEFHTRQERELRERSFIATDF